jgi:hypothetical protein
VNPKKFAESQLVENSSFKFDPPCLLSQAGYFPNTLGFGEGKLFQKMHNALPFRQDILY